MSRSRTVSLKLALVGAIVTLPAVCWSAEAGAKAPTPATAEVEMFAAIKAGQLDVKLVPKDSTQATVIFKNRTKQPLNVRLPEVFGGMPVLAQAVGAPRAQRSSTTSSNNNANQSVGGGFGGGGFGGGGFGGGGGGFGGGGGGFFNIPPEQVRKVKVAAVCLEHGKREPRAAVPYEITPLAQVTKDQHVPELLKALAADQCSQRIAQAAAWHYANGMSWDELAAKQRKHLNAPSEPYFSRAELQAALQLAQAAEQAVRKKPVPQPTSASESLSLSR